MYGLLDGGGGGEEETRVGVFRLRVKGRSDFFAEFLTNEKATHH